MMEKQLATKKISQIEDRTTLWDESKKLWYIAGPAILTGLAQDSIGIVTVAFVGHLGAVELAAVAIVQNVIEGFAYGIMLGMGSALETLCGQSVGAEQTNMLGVYMQRSWIICCITALILSPMYIFTSTILAHLHQTDAISDLAGKYAPLVIPQLFAYAVNFPLQKFMQSQSRVWVMTLISLAVLPFHVLLNWVLVTKHQRGMVGAAIAGNISWWLLVVLQFFYVTSGYFPEAWNGFSCLAFKSLAGFLKLSLASAVMICLELWYYTAIILLVSLLQHPEIAVNAVSICMNLQLWGLLISLGFQVAISVRVSNELGGGRPKQAKFAVVVAVSTSLLLGFIFAAAILASRKIFPKLFTGKPAVIGETIKLGYLLAATVLLYSVQPVLQGVAVGAGWQLQAAFINVGTYYIFGLPLGACLGYKYNLGVKGIWSGMLAGGLLQTAILLFVLYKTNWNKEVLEAEKRVKVWGGTSDLQQKCEERAEKPSNVNQNSRERITKAKSQSPSTNYKEGVN